MDGAVTSNMAVTPTSNGFVNAYASNPTQLLLDVSSYFAIPGGLSGNYTFSISGFDSAGPVLVLEALWPTEVATSAVVYST